MATVFVVCGKVNNTNLRRYSDRSDRTYRRPFDTGLGLEGLAQALFEQVTAEDSTQIAFDLGLTLIKSHPNDQPP